MLRAMRSLVVLVVAIWLVPGCKKEPKEPPAPAVAPVTAGTTGADGVRTIAITADNNGYTPSEIAAKPGEKLVLVFTRKVDGDCLAKVKVADAAPVDLPKGTPVEVPVTAPATGKLTFVCGMDMFSGAITVTGT